MKKLFTLLIATMLSITAMPQVITNGLVAYYPFNGNATDESGNGYNGTVNGATLTSDRFGNANSAYNFTPGNYIQVSNMPYNSSFSVCGYVNFSGFGATGGYSSFLSHKNQASNGDGWFLGEFNNSFRWYFNTGGGATINQTVQSMNIGQWYFFCWTNDGAGNNKLYLDGVLVATGSGSAPSAIYDFFMGKGTDGGTIYFNGKLDDIIYYNRALDEGEILVIFGATGNFTFSPASSIIEGNCINIIADPDASDYYWSTGDTLDNITSCYSSYYTLAYNDSSEYYSATSVFISSFNKNLAAPNDTVYSIFEANNKIYIGGEFDYVGPVCGYTASINNSTGIFDSDFPRINDTVNVVISDGYGGWFAGGKFTRAGVYNINNLVHIKADKTVDLNFIPNPNGEVRALYLEGNKLYVGGDFTNIGEVNRNFLAMLNINNGMGSSWDPASNGIVRTLSMYNNNLLAGGDFTNIGGQTRNYLSAIDTVFAQAGSWNPSPNLPVNKIALYGTKLYIAGGFSTIMSIARTRLACILLTNETLTTWNPNANNAVYDILPTATAIYLAGDFTNVGGLARNYLAAVNTTVGSALTWNPTPNNTVYSLNTDGTNIFTGGKFTTIGSDTRNCIAQISIASGLATTWNPDVHSIKSYTASVNSIATFGSIVFAGGNFYSMGGQTRNCAASIDKTTGLLSSWNPNVNNIVRAIYADNNYVYIGGDFTLVNGSILKNHIAQLNVSNAVATGWNPNADDNIFTITAKGTYLYVGGNFTNIGGNARPKLSALKISDGTSSTWIPNPNGAVRSLSIEGDSIYIGGDFTIIGGQTRNRVAAYNINNGSILSFNPDADNTVNAIAVKNKKVHIGGSFLNIGSQSRKNYTVFDANTNSIETCNISYFANTSVNTINLVDSVAYMGGDYSYYNNVSLPSLKNASAVQINKQSLSKYWHPEPNGAVKSILASNDKVFLGGDFTEALSVFQPFFTCVDNYCVANAHIEDPFTNVLCEGDVVYLNADTNAGYAYQWYINSVIIPGADSCSYAPTQSGAYSVEVTDNVNYGSLFSNIIHITVDSLPDTTITTSGPTQLCGAGSVTLFAETGTGYTYQWYKNGTIIPLATSSSYAANATGNYYAEIYNSSGCLANSQIIYVDTSSVNPIVTPDGPLSFCTGGSVTLTSDYSSGNLWYKNGVSTGQATQSIVVTQSGFYEVFVTDGICTGFSEKDTVTVNPNLPASVSIAANPGTTICSGTSVTFTATATNGGTTPAYQWKKNGTNISGATNSTYTSTALANGDLITCVLTSNATCATGSPATSNTLTMTVNSNLPVSVLIAANPGTTICAGTSVTFTATTTNGGTTPTYQWKKNGTNISGATNSIYTSSTLADADLITCVLTSNATCASGSPATSNVITMTVNPILPVSVSITANPGTSVCPGTIVTFTATATNGGTTPAYQWKKNGANISGATNSTYTSSTLADADFITCILTSNALCITGSPATSNTLTMTINASLPVSVSIAAIPGTDVCEGTSISFTATPVNGGTAPTYQWQNNGANISGATNYTYTSSALTSGDIITCILTANSTCATGSPATSNTLTITINPIPQTPVITQVGNDLNSDAVSGNQWYDDNGIISGATSQTYTPLVTGNYYCIVTDGNTCVSVASNVIYVLITGLSNYQTGFENIYIYPNPANTSVTIDISDFSANNNSIMQLLDINGKLLKSLQINGSKTQLNISEFAAGVYIVKISGNNGIAVKRMIKE